MSLIYHALSRLEKKVENGMQSSLSHISADQYVLASQRTGMPAWVKVLLVLCLLGMIAGFAAMTVLREQLLQLQTQVSSAPTAKTPVVSAPVALAVTGTSNAIVSGAAQAVPVLEAIGGNKRAPEVESQHAQPETKGTLPRSAPANLNPSVPSAEVEERGSDTKLAQTDIPASELSVVEIRVESDINAAEPKKGRREVSRDGNKKAVKKSDISQDLKRNSSEEKANQEVAHLIASVKAAIQSGRKSDADSLIQQLQLKLDAESLTLIHLKAWRQMQGGDASVAMNLYQHILNRNPEDEVAAINLALLQWRSGQQAEARKTIATIYARKPESDQLHTFARQFGVQP